MEHSHDHQHDHSCRHDRGFNPSSYNSLYPRGVVQKLEAWLESRSGRQHRNRAAALGFAALSFLICPIGCPLLDDIIIPGIGMVGPSLPLGGGQSAHPDIIMPKSMWVEGEDAPQPMLTGPDGGRLVLVTGDPGDRTVYEDAELLYVDGRDAAAIPQEERELLVSTS